MDGPPIVNVQSYFANVVIMTKQPSKPSNSGKKTGGPPPCTDGDAHQQGAAVEMVPGVVTRSRRLLFEQMQQQRHTSVSSVADVEGHRHSDAPLKRLQKSGTKKKRDSTAGRGRTTAMQLEIVPLNLATVLRSSIQAASSKARSLMMKKKNKNKHNTKGNKDNKKNLKRERDSSVESDASSDDRRSDVSGVDDDTDDNNDNDDSSSSGSGSSSSAVTSDDGATTSEDSDDDDDDVVPMELAEVYNEDEYAFVKALPEQDRERLLKLEEQVKQHDRQDVPARFRILQNENMDIRIKSTVIRKLNSLSSMEPGSGEYSKLQAHISALTRLPLGVYKQCCPGREQPRAVVAPDIPDRAACAAMLKGVQRAMDEHLYGQAEIKRQFMLTIAKWMSNPRSHGMVLGIEGPPGVGKTTLVKDCLAKAINLPCEFIPLGGANDAAFLDGHSFTYEGSTWGKIADAVMSAQCLNPILCFDELDKVADNRKGSEIFNVLTHLTDVTQNDAFCDKYFADIPLDLSRCIMVFTYNDASKVPRVLKDRMITLVAKPYSVTDKLEILRRHIIPKMEQLYGFAGGEVVLPDDVLRLAVTSSDSEGLRTARRLVESVFSHINLERLMGDDNGNHAAVAAASMAGLPVTVTVEKFNEYAKDVLGSLADERNGGPGFNKVSHMYV